MNIYETDTYGTVFKTEAVILFLLLFSLLYFSFSGGSLSLMEKRRRLFETYSPKSVIYIILAAAGVTLLVSEKGEYGVSAAVFLCALSLAPLFISNAAKRDRQEKIFSDVILYCQNTGMLLKQTHGVYQSVERAASDLSGDLKKDLSALLAAFGEDRETVVETMKTLEANYPYSCMKNLDAILLHMFYENANVDDMLLETYQDDVSDLEADVRKNRAKRKALRMSYTIITVGSFLTYRVFYESMADSLGSIPSENGYGTVYAAYIFASMLSYFAVDRYFCLNTTRE